MEEWLESEGWREGYRCWYKIAPISPQCCCNKHGGVPLALKEYAHNGWTAYELELTAEPDDGIWVKLRAYTIAGEELQNVLQSQCDKLLRAWVACNSVAAEASE